jgi:choline dehydrogenase-like flavoprotein
MTLRDARTDAVGDTLEASICIVGGGAAGITLARVLGEHVDGVVLVESGSIDFEPATQALYAGTNVGLPYHDLDICRLRYFGGTTNHWGGYCRSNDPINYSARPDLGLDGWPIDFEVMQPYVATAAALLGISDRFFEPESLLAPLGVEESVRSVLAEPDVDLAVNQIAEDIRFAERFGPALIASDRVHLVTNLNATEIELNEDHSAVSRIVCRTLSGKSVRVTARQFVLACHTIENARLLLASNMQEPDGIGNAFGHVGRHFMEHPYVHASILIPTDAFPEPLLRGWATTRGVLAGLSLTEAAMLRHGTLAYTCYFSREIGATEMVSAMQRLQGSWRNPLSDGFLDDVRTVINSPDYLAGSLSRRLGLGSDRPFLVLEQMIEQAPDPASRILLSETNRDPFGFPMADLDWRLNALDYHTFRTGQELTTRALGSLGFGRVQIEPIDEAMVAERVIGHYHHYGTTRMAASPGRGVVDPDLRVFGKSNLSICGASVFPTSGAHGPTLHVIAIALRLAERLIAETSPG